MMTTLRQPKSDCAFRVLEKVGDGLLVETTVVTNGKRTEVATYLVQPGTDDGETRSFTVSKWGTKKVYQIYIRNPQDWWCTCDGCEWHYFCRHYRLCVALMSRGLI